MGIGDDSDDSGDGDDRKVSSDGRRQMTGDGSCCFDGGGESG